MHPRRLCIALLTFLVCCPALFAGEAYDAYDVVDFGSGIHALIWREKPVHSEPNVLIIVNDADVVVVDSSLLPSTSRTIIREIKRLTAKPVRYVINTHWHDDHIVGNFVYRDTWPGVEFIAHPNTRIDAAEKTFSAKALAEDMDSNAKQLASMKTMQATHKRPDGTPISDEGLARLPSIIDQLTRFRAERPSVRAVLPDVLVTDSLTLERGSRTIEIRYLGRGNTRGDVVVYLPNEKILATGDLVVAPTPFGIGSYYSEWAATLEKLMQFDAKTIFLSHGPVQHDFTYVQAEHDLLRALVDRVADAVAHGTSIEDAKKNITLADWKQKLAGDDALEGRAFDAFFVTPAVERAYHQAKGDPDDSPS